jgi:hypothetical protein
VALTADQQERVLKTIKDRVGGDVKCPLCGQVAWMFTDGVAVIAAQEKLGQFAVPDRGLPALPMVCRQCGNTHFLNIFALGLSDLFETSRGS